MDAQKDRLKADKLFKEAESNMKGGWFSSPDYTSAATSFDQACKISTNYGALVKIYAKSGAHDKVLATVQKLIICNGKNNDPWAVARNHETKLDLYLDNKIPAERDQIVELAQRTYEEFCMAESNDKAFKIIERTANYFTKISRKADAVELMEWALKSENHLSSSSYEMKNLRQLLISHLFESEDYEKLIKYYNDKIQEAASVPAQKNYGLDSDCLCVVIVCLLMRNPDRAEQENCNLMNKFESYLTSSDCETASKLIRCYKQGNGAEFTKQTIKATITTLHPLIIVKKLRELKIGTTIVATKVAVGEIDIKIKKEKFVQENFL